MSVDKPVDWKNQYSQAIKKNRDWRDLYALITGRKGRPSEEHVKNELKNNKDRILGALKYFQTQHSKPSAQTCNKDLGNGWNKEGKIDVTAPSLIRKLQSMTGMESELAWEVLYNYLQYAFRGPPDSLQKLLAQNEEKAQGVVADLFCFYYRERMFILKICYHILTNATTDDYYSRVFSGFIRDNIKFSELYESLYEQLKEVSKSPHPDLSCLHHLSAPRYATFWAEHNLREQVQLTKLMMVTFKHCHKYLPPISRIKEILQLIEESNIMERESKQRVKESPFKVLRRFYVIHLIQLIGFDTLNAEDTRWRPDEMEVFSSINDKVRFLIDRKGEEGPALLCLWFIVHQLTPLGTSSPTMRELIAQTVRAANPWLYFNQTLTCPDIMDDRVVCEVAHYAVYQVAFLSVVNTGLDYVRCEAFYQLVALVVRDAHVLKHFWLTHNDGLQLVLQECERYFPITWSPTFQIYTSVASHSEFYVNQIEKRVEKEVKLTQLQTHVINMESLGNNEFRSLEPVYPFVSCENTVIPAGTRCIVSGDKDIYIHWQFSTSIWLIIKETLFRWSQKMVQYPKPSEEELNIHRKNVLAVLGFYNEMLKNRKEHKNMVFFAVDEMFSRIELYHERRDADMLNACLQTCTLLLKYYPDDVLAQLEVARVIPDMDKVIMTHVQCAQGHQYHSNGIKIILELVELNSGKFPVLVSYLEFILELFQLPRVFECWAALAGVQFVLRDVFSHYNQWIFADERERLRLQWLCVQILNCVLDTVTLADISPPQTSQLSDTSLSHLVSVLPNKNLFANTVLHHLLNWEPAIALIHIVSIGDQQLFSWVESFHSWDAKCCLELVGSVYTALSILNKCILLKHVNTEQTSLTRLEREIYKEPKETDTYKVVINVAGYVYNLLNPALRYNSVKLISRFADNRHQSLMACIGMEANTMRQMYLRPLYSSSESEEIKVSVLELVTECIHKQASLAEAFLNALELKECVQKESGEESEGFVHIALSIIRKRKDIPKDKAFLASVQLLQALWHERRTLVISYIRMQEHFFTNFSYPLFHVAQFQSEVVPAFAYILTCLATELYWHKDQVHSSFKKCITDLFEDDHLVRLSLYCTDQLHGLPLEECQGEVSHTADSTKILIAWKEFVYVLVKSFPELVETKPALFHVLCIHTLNALANELSRQCNMLAVSCLAELYLLLISSPQGETLPEQNLVTLKKVSSILSQVAHHYKFCTEPAIVNILASCSRFLASVAPKDTAASLEAAEWHVHTERVIRAVCTLLCKELELFLVNQQCERTRQTFPPLLCLGITLGQTVSGPSLQLWRDLTASSHITSQLIEATTATLQMKELSDSSLLMLEFLALLTRDDEWSFRQVDILELHSAWDSLKPPIQNLFGPNQLSLEKKSVFEATNWYPVYMRALNLASALVSHSCPRTRELGFDFIYQHEKFICDIFEFKDDSLKETALDLVSAGLRLLWHVIEAIVPWDWKLKTTLGRILDKVKLYVSTLVDLLGDPQSLLKCKALSLNQKMFPPAEYKGKDVQAEIQQLQSRLVNMLIENLSVLKKTCPKHSDLLAADRLGLPTHKLKLLVEPRPPAETGPEYLTLINLINLIAKRLASNLRISPRSSNTQLTSPLLMATKAQSKDGDKSKAEDNSKDTTMQQIPGKEETYFAAKLSGCDPTELRLLLELTVHYTITNTLLTILSDQMAFQPSIVFLRDLSTEAKTYLEYAQRLKYGKQEIKWTRQMLNEEKYKPLTWRSEDIQNIDDSVSLGCALLPEADMDESHSRPTSLEHVTVRNSKKLKVHQTLVPQTLQHFIPENIKFDPTFESTGREAKDIESSQLSEDENDPMGFILFCNHLLKQIFGMHGFDERSMRAGL